jgi:hypothetical protein
VAAAVVRARERLEVLLADGRLPATELRPAEPLEQALARAVDLAPLAHVEQLETLSGAGGVVTAYLGLVPADAQADGAWTAADDLPRLGADDAAIVAAARGRLRAKLSYTNLGFALAPSTFTISELRAVYVAALAHDVSATNLQRVLLRRGVIEQVEGRREPGRTGGRPAALFRFARRSLEVTDEFAAFGPPR